MLGGALALALLGAPRTFAAERLAAFTSGRAAEGAVAHDELDALLARYVHASADGINRVDYHAWSGAPADRRALEAYIGRLSAVVPAALARAEQFAYWANLYNAVTLRVVLEAWPVRSIRRIKPHPFALGPWKQPRVEVQQVALSLDDIEHGILRVAWQDPRVHYAVNCASIGCPNLRLRAFRGASLEQDLGDAARDYANHPRGARFDGEVLVVSSIYRWYADDFGGWDGGVIRHLQRYAAEPLRRRLAATSRIARHEYDWSLNGAER